MEVIDSKVQVNSSRLFNSRMKPLGIWISNLYKVKYLDKKLIIEIYF